VPDLERAGLTRKLCAPVRRMPYSDGDAPSDPFLPVQYARPWALVSQSDRQVLRRCGSRRTIQASGEYRDASLGGGWLLAPSTGLLSTRTFELRRLRDGRRFHVTVHASSGHAYARHTRRYLYVVKIPQTPGYVVVYRARLP
jgi:hypothetical protein